MDNKSTTGYTLGIVSIVLAFFQPLAALVLSIIGLKLSKSPDELSKKAKKLNMWGLVLSIIVLIITVAFMIYSIKTGLSTLSSSLA